MSVRYTEAQAANLGLIPAKPARRGGKTHTADGHAIDPAFLGVTEHEFQEEVKDRLRRNGWTCGLKDTGELQGLAFHAAHVMSQSEKGWPDWVAIRRRDRRLVFFELKGEAKDLMPRQAAVLDLLRRLEQTPLCGEGPHPLYLTGHPWKSGDPERRLECCPLWLQVFVWRPSQLAEITEVLR